MGLKYRRARGAHKAALKLQLDAAFGRSALPSLALKQRSERIKA